MHTLQASTNFGDWTPKHATGKRSRDMQIYILVPLGFYQWFQTQAHTVLVFGLTKYQTQHIEFFHYLLNYQQHIQCTRLFLFVFRNHWVGLVRILFTCSPNEHAHSPTSRIQRGRDLLKSSRLHAWSNFYLYDYHYQAVLCGPDLARPALLGLR